jgi:hypothetical protein
LLILTSIIDVSHYKKIVDLKFYKNDKT